MGDEARSDEVGANEHETPGEELDELFDELVEDHHVIGSTADLLKGGGGRIASDGLGPTIAFYIGYRTVGLGLGIGLALVVASAAWIRARRQGRSGLLTSIALFVVGTQAVTGLIADDARAFLAPQLLTGTAWGIAFIGSVVIGRPLVGLLAGEVYPFPDEVKASRTYRRVFGTVSIVFGVQSLLRVALRAVQLQNDDIDGYLVVSLLTGFPVTAVTIAWALWWSRRAFARSEEWGWALQP